MLNFFVGQRKNGMIFSGNSVKTVTFLRRVISHDMDLYIFSWIWDQKRQFSGVIFFAKKIQVIISISDNTHAVNFPLPRCHAVNRVFFWPSRNRSLC